jgi:CheY-like chemotaxis protein
MLVDDVPGTRDLLRQMLEGQGVNVAAECDDGLSVLERVFEHDIDVVVMDVRMPHLDGIQATRLLKKRRPDVQVIMFSILDDDREKAASKEAGAFTYLVKGASFLDLRQRIFEAYTARDSAAS